MSRYHIQIADRAGPYGGIVCTEYRDMAKVVRDALRVHYPDKVVEIYDAERDGRAIDPDEDDDNG